MKDFIIYVPLIREIILWAVVIWQRKIIIAFIYAMLGEPGKPGSISSRRSIAISSTATLLYLCWFVVTKSTMAEPKTLEPAIAWCLFALIGLSMGYATFTQAIDLTGKVGDLFTKMKSLMPADKTGEENPADKVTINNNIQS